MSGLVKVHGDYAILGIEHIDHIYRKMIHDV